MAGGWDRKLYVGNELYKKILGVVGLGKIGSHVARVARAMGMDVAGLRPVRLPERAQQMQVRLLTLPQLFAEADYISLHLPRTPDTENLVNAELLRTMKPTARLVNCARGGIVDEAALAEAVESGTIAGAALDVYGHEPLGGGFTPAPGEGPADPHAPPGGLHRGGPGERGRSMWRSRSGTCCWARPARSAVNIPGLTPEVMDRLKPHLQLAETLGQLLIQLAGGSDQ
jgi:D-3-phosphoglycerate dehydrogenase